MVRLASFFKLPKQRVLTCWYLLQISSSDVTVVVLHWCLVFCHLVGRAYAEVNAIVLVQAGIINSVDQKLAKIKVNVNLRLS